MKLEKRKKNWIKKTVDNEDKITFISNKYYDNSDKGKNWINR